MKTKFLKWIYNLFKKEVSDEEKVQSVLGNPILLQKIYSKVLEMQSVNQIKFRGYLG